MDQQLLAFIIALVSPDFMGEIKYNLLTNHAMIIGGLFPPPAIEYVNCKVIFHPLNYIRNSK